LFVSAIERPTALFPISTPPFVVDDFGPAGRAYRESVVATC
jgi:hypothetical protein